MMSDPKKTTFPGRVAVQQRVLPEYRVPFFDLLAESCEGGLKVFAGLPRAKEGIQTADSDRDSLLLSITKYPFVLGK